MDTCTDEDEEDQSMSMMSGTDIFRTDDKVRVFGASLDSKVASRGQGLQDGGVGKESAVLARFKWPE